MLCASTGRKYGNEYITNHTIKYAQARPFTTKPTHPSILKGPNVIPFLPLRRCGRIAAM
jgi:hypothetical protein